jgi:hypothetical protein
VTSFGSSFEARFAVKKQPVVVWPVESPGCGQIEKDARAEPSRPAPDQDIGDSALRLQTGYGWLPVGPGFPQSIEHHHPLRPYRPPPNEDQAMLADGGYRNLSIAMSWSGFELTCRRFDRGGADRRRHTRQQ